MQPCPALEIAPRAKGTPPTQVAPNQKKRRAAEAEESDDDFAPKKGSKKGGIDTKTESGNTNKRSAASMAKTKVPSQRSHQVKSVISHLLCACFLLVVNISHLSCCPRQSRYSQEQLSIYVYTYLYVYIQKTHIHTKSLNTLCASLVLLTLFLVCRTRQGKAA